MNFSRFSYLTAATLAFASTLVGCDPDSKEIGATAGETDAMTSTATGGEESTESESATSGMTSTSGEPTSTSDSPTDSGGSEETGTTVLEFCEDAVSEEQCDLANEGFTFCGWFDVATYALDNEGACGDLKIDTGRCFADGWEDSGCFDYPPTCADGVTRVFYQEVGLEVGAVELVSFPFEDICEAPAGYEPCMYIDDGMTQTWDPPECACACPAA